MRRSLRSLFALSAGLAAVTAIAGERSNLELKPVAVLTSHFYEGSLRGPRGISVDSRRGEIWVADYKTDRTSQEDVLARAEEYRTQAEIYMEAVARCLGVTPTGFQFIFLRTGTVVPVLLQGGRA